MEILRSGYDIDGVRVELSFDEAKGRFSVSTRYAHLAHLPVQLATVKWMRITLERASATFEAACLHGATKEVARVAKRCATAVDSVFCNGPSGYEREVLRRVNAALAI